MPAEDLQAIRLEDVVDSGDCLIIATHDSTTHESCRWSGPIRPLSISCTLSTAPGTAITEGYPGKICRRERRPGVAQPLNRAILYRERTSGTTNV